MKSLTEERSVTSRPELVVEFEDANIDSHINIDVETYTLVLLTVRTPCLNPKIVLVLRSNLK